MKLQSSWICKAGGRKVNEDSCVQAEKEDKFCFVIADGLGGHRGGEIASKTASEAFVDAFLARPSVNREVLQDYLEYARSKLQVTEENINKKGSLKTTLVTLLVNGRKAVWAHIGDSRLYLFREGELIFQTRDHSVPQRLADSGAISHSEIRFHEDRNRLIAAFNSTGFSACIFSDLLKVSGNEVFLLCSDGFWEYVLESEMERLLVCSEDLSAWLGKMEELILASADAGYDNYTALAVKIFN